jgi:hypothetical protein
MGCTVSVCTGVCVTVAAPGSTAACGGAEFSFGSSVARILTSSAGAAESVTADSCGGAGASCGGGLPEGEFGVVDLSATGGSGSGGVGVAIAIAGGVGLSLLFADDVFRIDWISAGIAASVLSCFGGGGGAFISPVTATSALF